MEYHFSTRTGIVILIEAWNETIFFKKYVWVVFFGRFFFIFTAYTYSNIKFNNPNCILNICYFSHNEFQINHKNSWYRSYWCVSTMNLFSKCIDFESKLVFFVRVILSSILRIFCIIMSYIYMCNTFHNE